MRRRREIALIVLCCLAILAGWAVPWALAQDVTLDEETAFERAAQAVVRLRACQGNRCEIGSGVLIDPNGIILTAWHVVALDATNLASAFRQNLEVQMSDDVASEPTTRYRAQVIASKPEQDLALLRVVYDVQAGSSIALGASLNLPWLKLSDQTPRVAQLRVLGYPPTEGETLSHRRPELSGLEANGSLLRVDDELNAGFSGGPALIRRDNEPFEIIGLVIKRRGEVGVISSIRQLQELKWQRDAQQAWAEAIKVRRGASSAGGVDTVQIHFDLHALDLAGRQLQVRVFLMDAASNQLWAPQTTNLPTTETGQVFLAKMITIDRFAMLQPTVTLNVSAAELGVEPERLKFRVTLWNEAGTFNFWQSLQAYVPQDDGEAVALAPGETVTTQITLTDPPPDRAATTTAEAQEVETAIAATLAARASPTLKPADRIATAVAATLAAEPTSTSTPTNSPTMTATDTPPPTDTSTPTSTPAFSGLVTYVRQEGDKKSLYILNPDGTSVALVTGVADLQVLDISPDRRYLAIAVSEQLTITHRQGLDHFVIADAVYVVSTVDGAKSESLIGDGEAADIAYAADGHLVVASHRDMTIRYLTAEKDGSNPHELYRSIFLSDQFNTNEYDWPTGDYSDSLLTGNRQISDGMYRWIVNPAGNISWWAYPRMDVVSDFYLTAVAQRISGPTNGSYGIVFRSGDGSFYVFRINDDQQFGVELWDQGEVTTLIDWSGASAIRPGETNRLAVIAKGSHFTFFINHEQVGEVEDTHLSRGIAGLAVGLSNVGEELVFEFSEFELLSPP